MKYLLDSHILIWALFADEKLPGEAYTIVNDPFDKMLIAQAKTEGMTFLTHDHLLKDYGESCVKTV